MVVKLALQPPPTQASLLPRGMLVAWHKLTRNEETWEEVGEGTVQGQRAEQQFVLVRGDFHSVFQFILD
jgi:hypothetical protein